MYRVHTYIFDTFCFIISIMSEAQTPITITDKNLVKMNVVLERLDVRFIEEKKRMDEARAELRNIRKEIERIQKKQDKINNKPKKARGAYGFAKPTPISEEMCGFLGKEPGTLVSRTEVTKEIVQYIKMKNLQNPSNRRQILLDDTLKSLFGPETEGKTVDYFSMQRYVNKHFPKQDPTAPVEPQIQTQPPIVAATN